MESQIEVFDRRLVRRHRDRAAVTLPEHDFLYREVAGRLVERLDEVTRQFPVALDLGCNGGILGELLQGHGGIERLIQCDLSPAMARRAAARPVVVADEEALPFAPGSFDLVLSDLTLHWVNDLPGALLQIARSLRPDGLFLAALLGGRSLYELRAALMEAELAEESGASPRVSPLIDIRDAGSLLQRAGFALPIADSDSISVSYGSPFDLMRDLRGMGQTNALRERRKAILRRSTLLRAAEIYGERFTGSDGRIQATFEVIFLTAWAPAASQPRPLSPGSAKTRLADALGTREIKAGEKAPRG